MQAIVIAALLALPADFTPWFAERGVNVEISRPPNGTPWIRGTFEIPVPADKVIAVVTDFRRYKEIFDPALERATVLAHSTDGARLHMVWPYPTPMRDRDAVVVYKVERMPDGGAIVSWHGDAHPKDPQVGVRIKHVEGQTRIEPAASGTRVTYTYVGDLGGSFPQSITERVWKGEPIGYMQALRRAVGLPLVKK